MKIVHCIYSLNTGGAETMLVDILNEQAKTEEVTLIIVNESFQANLVHQIDKRVKIIYLRRKPASRSVLPIIRLNYLLFALHPDVIHVHNYSLPKIIFPLVGRRLFFTVHDLHIPLSYAERATCLFAISNAVKQDILSKGNYPVLTIPNGIITEKIVKRKKRVIPAGKKMKIVEVARLDTDKKGQDILIKAVALLKKKGLTHISVDFIGTGKSENTLKNLAKELGVEKQIRFLGLRSRNYIYSHLQTYDLMCHPARYEGFGLTVAEGMAARLPVLVSNGEGPYEIIAYGKFGYAFENKNFQDCANKIEAIYNNYPAALNGVDRACRHIVTHYSVKRMVQLYLNAYRYGAKPSTEYERKK